MTFAPVADGFPARARREDDDQRRLPSTAAGERLYVIGDIHGCYELWLDLLDRIENHARALPEGPAPQLILLGDMIDRGPGSKKVLRVAYETQRLNTDLIVLLGNHELMMLDALARRKGALDGWLRAGGQETLRSFGIEPPFNSKEVVTALREAIPAEWVDWLRQLPLSIRSGDYFFCHAGVRPGVAIKRQLPRDLLWIRDDFVNDAGEHGVVVVHGHSVCRSVEVRHNRIGVDTGAYTSGELSAVYLEGTRRELISTRIDQPTALPAALGLFPE